MENAIICSDRPVTLVGSGPLGPLDLDLALERAPVLVAADGGAMHALSAGHMPRAVIGDMDSLDDLARARFPADRIFRIAEQDSTDFDKSVRSIQSPVILAVGFLGGRIDHQLAAFNTLVRHASRVCLLIGQEEVIFHLPPALTLDLADGDGFSLFPMRPVTGSSVGLRWPIDGLDLAPDRRIATSNRATGTVQLRLDGPGALAMVPRTALDAVMRGFAAISPD
ncbi:thiamine diphosphokinase [Sedimentitalea sp. JM2-8]|uniref:Thiamine diphosphokinase n=1 Tax=Sedimentitalea xiamensis TaxID=3050037 RepID=A0ABT7F9U2_9RHOB|nr:thiamine diphosphokinase [Sedimentitalea xiamensis]MDK3071877.1 thiamine diphosphokinase [Sedimentitalea xiamensis]